MVTLAVIVSYNDAKNTVACVQSLIGQARIIVWDNNSQDDTLQKLSHFDDITVHASPKNLLWTPALNEAFLEYHNGEDFLLASNNDIVYRPDTIQRLESAFLNPAAGIVAPAGSRLGGLQDFATNHPKPHEITHQTWVDAQPTVRTNYVVGASMMIKRECWEEVGTFDYHMPLGADDHDYCIRAKANEWTIWVVNSAYVDHVGHASFAAHKETWNEWGEKSWEWFNKKWEGYYVDEDEAVKCHWNPVYTPGWDFGTGWLVPEMREEVYKGR